MITFNVLYIPGTVASLRPFPLSLARWSPAGPSGSTCRFRLVANGCLDEERRILQDLCAAEPRFEYLEISSSDVLPHGVALAQLQRREESSTFAFIDSDVFAVGPWLVSAQEELMSRDAVFSCSPVWSDAHLETLPRGYRILGGAFLHLADGRCIGNSYFGIYDNRRLRETIERHGVSFERRQWKQVPAHLQGLLQSEGLAMDILDTGRLLNLLLCLDGRELAFLPLPGLGHIGGVSGLRRPARNPLPARAVRKLRRGVAALLRRGPWRAAETVSAGERSLNLRKARCRRATVTYFTGLLEALAAGETHENEGLLRELAVEEPSLVQRIQATEGKIRSLYGESIGRERLEGQESCHHR